MLYDTIREATYEWGREFNAVSRGIVEKLIKADGGAGNAISEVTPPSVGNYADGQCPDSSGLFGQGRRPVD